MKKKGWVCAILALALLLAAAERLTRDGRDVHTACAYLQSQKYDESDPEAVPVRSDPIKSNPAGRILSIQVNSNPNIDLLISCVGQAQEVRRVDAIPELPSPRVRCGENLLGNWERLYYTDPASRHITEFTLTQADSMRLGLCLTPYGPACPEILELYVSELTDYLQSRMPEEGEDQFKVSENGYLESVNIRTQETLDRYLDCVRNSVHIEDTTDRICGIWVMPPYVRVAGRDTCDCEYVTYTSPATGRHIAFALAWEDTVAFAGYLADLAQAKNPYSPPAGDLPE